MISWFEKNSLVSWLFVLIIAVGIFYVSSLTFPPSEQITSLKSVYYHISAFFIFAFFLLISLVKGKNKKLLLVGFLVALIYGILEFLM